ncbi:MAG: pitrilysin family protein [Capsulimonadales bacterium]|nr:pitrilysin family protein [Capsulimonadales bacterium]
MTGFARSLLFLFVAGGIALTPRPLPAQEPVPAPVREPAATNTTAPAAPVPATVQVLNNGVRLIVLPDPTADTVSVNVFFNIGRADERNHPGINALLCRTWGNASAFRTAPLLQNDIARVGSVGTEYSEDWVEIWGISDNDSDAVRESFRTVLVNLVTNPLFTPEAVTQARQEQERSLSLEQDDLLTSALEILRRRAFGGSPYGISAAGVPERLVGIRAETLDAYYRRLFRPNRCVVAVAGKVDPDRMRRLAEASFGAGDWNRGPTAPPVPDISVSRIPAGLRDLGAERQAASTLFLTGWLAPGLAQGGSEAVNRKRYATLLLLDAVLGGGKSARLFRSLRDMNPIGYDIRTTLQPGRGASLWCVYVTGDRDRETCRAAVGAELAMLMSGQRPVTEPELERARTYCRIRRLRDAERVRDRAFYAGWCEVMGLGAAFATDFDRYLEAVTPEDVNELARRLLTTHPVTVFSQPATEAVPSPMP